MPRKGRLVQPRHIFPWLAAPWIEFLRVLWRIERFFLTPIRYLQAWTMSAIFGVVGVVLSVALFIPRLTESGVEASSGAVLSNFITPGDMPYLPPARRSSIPSGTPVVETQLQRTWVPYFDQLEELETHSQIDPLNPRTLLAHQGLWKKHLAFGSSFPERLPPVRPYAHVARIRRETVAPEIPEYLANHGDPTAQPALRMPSLYVTKEVPASTPPGEPFTYFLVVHNTGQETIESALIREKVILFDPAEEDLEPSNDIRRNLVDRIIEVDPPAEVSSDLSELVWDLHQLQPDEKRRLRVTMQPDEAAELSLVSEVELVSAPVFGEIFVREKHAPTVRPTEPVVPQSRPRPPETPEPVVRKSIPGVPRLVLRFEPREAEVMVGDVLNAYYTITNVGTADATDVLLMVAVPEQLRHLKGELIQHQIAVLKPNEARRALFAAIVEGPGRIPLEWSLSAQNVEEKQSTEWLETEAQPASSIPDHGLASPNRSSIPTDGAAPDLRLRPEPDPNPTAMPVTIGGPRDRVAPTIPPEGLPTPPPNPLRPLREPSTGPASPLGVTLEPGELKDNWHSREQPIVPELTPDELPLGGFDSGPGSSIPRERSVPHHRSIPTEDPAPLNSPLDLGNIVTEPDTSPNLPKSFPSDDPLPTEETKIQ